MTQHKDITHLHTYQLYVCVSNWFYYGMRVNQGGHSVVK